ncbi:hypothetical protein FRC00_004053 [Tulasnella sp. 408]|nr:hypothetical protein FRC00_004053 [Tulasnella sp. 408]
MSANIQRALTRDAGPNECHVPDPKAHASLPLNAKSYDLPIHRLPAEILVEIVRYYIQQNTGIRHLVRLTQVCKRWSIIIQDAPILWTTIDAADGPLAIRKALQAAKDALLDLKFDYNTAQMAQRAFFKCVGEQSGRWRTLVVLLQRPAWDSIFEELQKGTPSSLKALRLSAQYMTGVGNSRASVFGGNPAPPGLEEIFLANVPINLASLQLSGLRSLTIRNTPGVLGTDIVNVIRGSPAIESISLEFLESITGIPPLHSAFSHPLGNPSIQLASLVYLTLYHITLPFLKFLLSAIAAHRLETLKINIDVPNMSDAQLLLECLRQQLSTLARLTTDAQNFKLVASSWGSYQIDIGGLNLRLWAKELPINALVETWDWGFNHSGKSLRNLPAYLDVGDWNPEIPALLEWLTHRLTITKLRIHTDFYYSRAVLEPIISLLSRPTTSTAVTWLLPQVEILETNLVRTNGNDDLVEMVTNRHSAEDGKDGVAAPKPFREIWLTFGEKLGVGSPDPVNMEFLRKVQEVASGADVYWEGNKLERSG